MNERKEETVEQPAIKAKVDKLADLQKSLGHNDTAMAALIGCTRQTYRNALEGKNVSAGFIARLTLVMQVPFDTYFELSTENENTSAA